MDIYGFYTGQIFDAHKYLGAHREQEGYSFRVYAPHASRITLVGTFNDWQDWEMNRIMGGHFWEVFVPQAKEGDRYLYKIWHSMEKASWLSWSDHAGRCSLCHNFVLPIFQALSHLGLIHTACACS